MYKVSAKKSKKKFLNELLIEKSIKIIKLDIHELRDVLYSYYAIHINMPCSYYDIGGSISSKCHSFKSKNIPIKQTRKVICET